MNEIKSHLFELIKMIIDKANFIGWPSTQQYVVSRKEEYAPFADIEIDEKINEELFLDEIREEVWNMSPFNEIYKAIKSDERLSNIFIVDAEGNPLDSIESERAWLLGTIIGFINDYLIKSKRELDVSTFDSLFQKLVREVETNEIINVKISPLYNLQLRIEQVEFTENLKIRKLTNEELELWANSYIFPLRPDEISPLQCALEIRYTTKRGTPITNEFHTLQDQVIQTLRLYFNTNIYVPFTYESCDSYFDRVVMHNADVPERMRDRLEYIEDKKSIEILNIWTLLQYGINKSKLTLALRRWSNSFGRSSLHDKIIDYWIGFESLITPDSNQEIKFRASLRIAKYIGDNQINRQQIFERIKKSYDRRSEIVHGSLKERTDLNEISEYTGRYLQTTMLKILFSEEEFNPISIDLSLID